MLEILFLCLVIFKLFAKCCNPRRFIINLPEKESQDVIRVFFQVELAHWFYLDFYWSENLCKACSLKEFAYENILSKNHFQIEALSLFKYFSLTAFYFSIIALLCQNSRRILTKPLSLGRFTSSLYQHMGP